MSSFKSLKDLLDANCSIKPDSRQKTFNTHKTSEAFDFEFEYGSGLQLKWRDKCAV